MVRDVTGGPDDRGGRLDTATRAIWIGIWVNLAVTIFKLAAGVLGRSQAMLADGVESLVDFPANLVVLFGLVLSDRPPDETHDYGHGKIETLSSTIVGLLLLGAGLWILGTGSLQIWRSLHGVPLHRPGMIAFTGTLVAIVVKEGLFRYTAAVARTTGSQVMMAGAWHHRSDALTSLGTLAGIGGAIFLGERWRILDPLAASLVSLFILKVACGIVRQGVDELLEASEPAETEEEILRLVNGVEGISNPHRLRTRRLGATMAVDIHVEVPREHSVEQSHRLACAVEDCLRDRFGHRTVVMVHVEPLGYRETPTS